MTIINKLEGFEMTPGQRLARMRASFEKKRAFLLSDYDFFATPRESIPPSKAGRKLAERSLQQYPKPNEKRSLGRSGG